jgi:hypothetical protein
MGPNTREEMQHDFEAAGTDDFSAVRNFNERYLDVCATPS